MRYKRMSWRRMTSLTIAAAIVISMLASLEATADEVLFDNGVIQAQINLGAVSDYDGDSAGVFRADDFVLANDSVVSTIFWTGFYSPEGGGSTEDFELAFYNDNGDGAPSATPFFATDVTVNSTIIGQVPVLDVDLFEYEADLGSLRLDGQTNYWLSIRNRTFNDEGDWLWAGNFFADGVGNLGRLHTSRGNAPWEAFDVDAAILDIRIEGQVVPEPSASAVLGCLIFVLSTRRRTN